MIEKIDYNKLMKEEINKLTTKPKLLLHACCAPCSSSVLERLFKFFNVTIFFYNSNMDNLEEFEKRKSEIIRFVAEFNKTMGSDVKIVVIDYDHQEFLKYVCGLETEIEGGKRCEKCFTLRLKATQDFALKNKFDYFTTTLTVSPHKNANLLNKIGKSLETEKLKYLVSDFKKEDGYKRSIELSKEYSLYRQNYCGCEFSKQNFKEN